MEIRGAALIQIILLLASMISVADLQTLQPDCTALQPAPCSTEPVLDENNKVTYDSYIESCPSHICTQVRPIGARLSSVSRDSDILSDDVFRQRLPASFESSPELSNSSACAVPPPSAPSLDILASTSEKVAYTFQYNPTTKWFCSALLINYTARVEANTGYPPGYKEDQYAECLYLRLQDSQSLGDCRHLRYGCPVCLDYYRNWLCAVAFPKCIADQTVVSYPAVSSSSSNSTPFVVKKVFSLIKPCRALCFGVVQTCQNFMGFNCPLVDTRDYADYPSCNALGLDQGPNPYAKSIYR